ncbi:conserved domain protein [Verrucomicrobiia bacterium DG1235]|nr:conserved domain protein [Verrucomicrobiae bacterium DG1235]
MSDKSSSRNPWRKRILISGLVLFTLYLCFGIWGVPAILVSQAQKHGSEALGREVTIGRASFNPFSFETKIYNLVIAEADGKSGSLLKVGKLSANVQLSSVFGTILLKSVEIEDSDIWITKDAAGRLSFQDVLDGFNAEATPDEEEPSSEITAQIMKTSVDNFNLHFTDSSLPSDYEETLTIESFNGRDIGTVEKVSIKSSDTGGPAYHWDFGGVVKTASGANLAIDGGATGQLPWSFELNASLADFPLASLQAYIDESVIAQVEGALGFDFNAQIVLAEEGAEIVVAGDLGLNGFSISDPEQEFVALESLTFSGLRADAVTMDISIADVSMASPAFSAILLEDGSLRLPAFRESTSSVASAAEEENAPFVFTAAIEGVSLSKGSFAFEDRSLATPFSTIVENIELALSDLKATQTVEAYDASGGMSLGMTLLGGSLQLDSKLEALRGLATATLAIDELQLSELQSYVSEYANVELQEGAFSAELSAKLESMANPSATGSLKLSGLKLNELGNEREMLALQRLSLEGIEFLGDSVSFKSVQIVEPLLTVWQNEEGANLSRIAKIEEKAEEVVSEVEAETGLAVNIETFELLSGGVDFVDTTPLSTHKSRISGFDVKIESISANPESLASFEFRGTIDGSARLQGEGKLNVMDPKQYLDLDMSFRGYDLTATSPYWETYLGRALAKGQFEITSKYSVRDNQLDGTNNFRIDQLTLGEKVESDQAMSLPLGFAIKLMSDPSGVISYDGLPVQGDLSDPQVKPWGLVGRAIRNLILNAVASPFKFLAGMVGGRDDLDTIQFEMGSVEISPEGLEKVAALQQIMKLRPGLTIDVAYKMDEKEASYLLSQYEKRRLLNPAFEAVSGLDLLQPIDGLALRAVVTEEYTKSEELGSESVAAMSSGDASPPAEEATPGKTGVVKRLVGVFKRKKEEVDSAQDLEENSPEVAPIAEEASEVRELSFEEKLTVVLSKQPSLTIDDNWLADLASERIQNFKLALLADEAIDNSRVFATELPESDTNKPVGSLLIKVID